jgi:hypothetical protein
MATDHSSGSVTEEQDGQFSLMSEVIPATVVKHGAERHAGEAAELLRRDAGDVQADTVTMERSGAERVEGERVTMTSSGARSLSARSLQMENSGAVAATAERMVLQGSSAIIARADHLRAARSRMLFVGVGEMTAEQDVATGMLNAGTVSASGDVRAVFLASGEVSAEGDVQVTFDPMSAFALGAGIAAGLLVLGRLFRRLF